MAPSSQVDLAGRALSNMHDNMHDPEFTNARRSLGTFSVAVEIGTLNGPEQEVFGAVKAVALDLDQRLYVLDSQYSEVRVFNTSGDPVAVVGRRGRGPGEFMNPAGLAIDDRQELYVGDASGVIQIFEWRDDTLQYKRSFRVQVQPIDMCFMNGSLYVHGLSFADTRLIHVYDRDGVQVRSFGVLYRSGNSLVDYSLARGLIECDVADNTVVYASRLVPELRGYSPEGDLLWRTVFRGYKRIECDEFDGGARFTIPEAGFHRVEALAASPDGYLALSAALVTRQSWSEHSGYAEVHTLAIDGKTGSGTAISDIGSPIRAISRSYYVVTEQDPFPRVAMRLIRPR